MIDGVELFTLRQRRSADGKTFFTGKLGTAAIVVVRDDFEPDVWKVIAGDPFRGDARSTSPARAVAPPVDDGDLDEGAFDEGWRTSEMDDSIPSDVALPSRREGR